MAKMVLLASYVAIGGNDLSDFCSQIELTAEIDEQDVTTFGDSGWKAVLGGLASGSLALTFKQDVAASQIDSIMWPLFLTRTPQTFEVRADSGSVGADNPSYSGNVLVREWKPLAGSVGDVAEVEVTFPTSGAITRATS